MNPSEFIEDPKNISPSDWIMNYADIQSKMWEDLTENKRLETMIGAVIAYLEIEWLKNKKTPPK